MKRVTSIILAIAMMISMASICITANADYINPPSKVENIYVEEISKTSVKLYWSQFNYYNDVDGYEVYTQNNDEYSYVATVKLNTTGYYRYNVVNLKSATKYTFAIRAFRNGEGERIYSEYSDNVSAYTALKEPSITSAKYISKGKMEIKWKSVPNASGYLLEYCTNSKFINDGTTCYIDVSKNTKSKTISSLAKKKYYVRMSAYISSDGNKYCSDYAKAKSVNIKQGCTVKEMINSIGTGKNSRNLIKKYTNNGVDINKYSSTYDRFKAIYDWHSKHNTDFGWSCLNCNSNFNACIAALFENKKIYEGYIYLACDNFKNNDGSVVMHKWSIIYLSGMPYIFDPRLQGYTGNKTGTMYFGISPNSSVGKHYLFDGMFSFFPTKFEKDEKHNSYYPVYDYPYIHSIERPAVVNVTATPTSKAIKLSWKKVSKAKGYQIQYSTKKDMSSSTTVEIDSNKTLAKTISKLKSKKTYYIRMRAYKTVGNNRIYSYWSSTKTVKTK